MATDPSTRIAYLVRRIANALTQQVEAALRPVGLTQAQLGALTQLVLADEALSGAELGRRTGVTPQSMATALSDLLGRELVTRRPHPTHGRKLDYLVTDAGRETVEHAQGLTAPVDARVRALLDDADAQQLRELLLDVAAGLGLPNVPSRPHAERTRPGR